jgi:hypothetical protein
LTGGYGGFLSISFTTNFCGFLYSGWSKLGDFSLIKQQNLSQLMSIRTCLTAKTLEVVTFYTIQVKGTK